MDTCRSQLLSFVERGYPFAEVILYVVRSFVERFIFGVFSSTMLCTELQRRFLYTGIIMYHALLNFFLVSL